MSGAATLFRGLALAALVGALAAPAPARASQVCGEPPLLGVEIWSGAEALGTEVDWTPYYPDRAARQRLEGSAQVFCNVVDDIIACQVNAAGPPDYGFELSALKIAGKLDLPPGPTELFISYRILDPRGKTIPCPADPRPTSAPAKPQGSP